MITPGRDWLLVASSVVALLAVAQAYLTIPVRRRVLKHLNGIIEGDALHVYALALYGMETDVKVSASARAAFTWRDSLASLD